MRSRKRRRRQGSLPDHFRNPFRCAAEALVTRWAPERAESRSGSRNLLYEEITALSEGKRSERAVREYYVQKLTLLLMLTTGALAGFLLLLPLIMQAPGHIPDKGLRRPDYGQNTREQELIAEADGAEHQVTVQIHSRKHNAAQVQDLLEKGREEVETGILGENLTADEVRLPLHFPSALADGEVAAEYLTVPYGLIGQDGAIIRDVQEEGELVEITVSLKCQGQELLCKQAVRVFPAILKGEEQVQRILRRGVQEAEADQAESEYFVLPDRTGTLRVSWKFPVNENWKSLLLLMLITIPAVYFGMDLETHRKAARRREQMETDYPELLWNMTILLGAGMTIRAAFCKLAASYEKKEHRHGKRYVYEEICYTCREMQSGVPEAQAYERFGKRCALQSYIKLGSLLAQNMKKGSGGLARLLGTEAALSLEEQKRLARKQGENARTKMLFPMVLMLGIVMMMLMVPAFMAM